MGAAELAVVPDPEGWSYFWADRVNLYSSEGIARSAEWDVETIDTPRGPVVRRGLMIRDGQGYRHHLGLPPTVTGSVHAYLRAHAELVLRLHHALWGLYLERAHSQDADPWVAIKASDLCEWLGYRRQTKGYQPRDRLAIVQALEALRYLEIKVAYADNKGHEHQLASQLWHVDLVETVAGHLVSIRLQPGAWARDATWRVENPFPGRVSRAVLRLHGHNGDRGGWAALLGLRLASLGRLEGGATRTLKVRSLLAASGLANRNAGHPAGQLVAFVAGLDQLREVGALVDWAWLDPDVDDWRARRITVIFPRETGPRAPHEEELDNP
jgi:hypothetical protein